MGFFEDYVKSWKDMFNDMSGNETVKKPPTPKSTEVVLRCDEIAYVSPKAGKNGWLLVSENSEGGIPTFSIPVYLKVKITGKEHDRIQFTILEGRLKGMTASVTKKYGPHLTHTNLRTEGAKLVLNLTTKKLTYNGTTIDAFTQEIISHGKLDPLPFGTWKIKIPYEIHSDLGEGYLDFSKYSMTWFPIKTPKTLDRFVHVGAISHGCATIGINQKKAKDFNPKEDRMKWLKLHRVKFETWTGVYEYLIKSRLDDKYVGEIEVIK